VGYGPESMYVAYNPFYPSELTQVEKRNASPDRSHNETWDSLVTTGFLGFLVYLYLFGSVVYYGLKWLGLIFDDGKRNLFLALFIGCGIISALGFIMWRGISYVGVALPFGMVVGVILYLTIIALGGAYEITTNDADRNKVVLLAVLLSAIIAHWLEINFGIAIVVTRLYFWVFAALLILLGYRLSLLDREPLELPSGTPKINLFRNQERQTLKKTQRKKRRSGTNQSNRGEGRSSEWVWEAIASGVLISILLSTMGYEFISATQGGNSAFAILWNSLTKLKNIYSGISYGVMAMVITSWIAGILLLNSEAEIAVEKEIWIKRLGIILGVSFFLGGIYWLWHAGYLAKLISIQPSTLSEVLVQVQRYESLLTIFYIFILFLLLVGAYSLSRQDRGRNYSSSSWQGILTLSLSIFIIPYLAVTTNLRIIQADIAFKLAEPFNNEKSWPVAIEIYKHAIEIAPSEDYYYLFLGRAYLENAKIIENPAERDALIASAERDLQTAQSINPLNTDHTANLARLYSLWSVMADDPEVKKERAEKSSAYFSKAVTLSPNNSRLWDEWALLDLNNRSNPEQAFERLKHSEQLDPFYDWTQALLGEYYIRMTDVLTGTTQKREALNQALFHYGEAVRLSDDVSTQANYSLAQAQLAINSQQYTIAIAALSNAIKLAPESSEVWKYEQTLAQLYAQTGDKLNALAHASKAFEVAPDDQKSNIQILINQIRTMQ
jgi:tetratricopeptide (TPR) repeat protein